MADVIRESGVAIVAVLAALTSIVSSALGHASQKRDSSKTQSQLDNLQQGLVTNHGSTSTGNAIDRITETQARITETLSGIAETQARQESATAVLTGSLAATRKSLGGIRDDMRGLRAETSDRVSELADRLTAESDRQSTHERTCPARLPLARAIHHPINPLQEDS